MRLQFTLEYTTIGDENEAMQLRLLGEDYLTLFQGMESTPA